MQMGNALNEVSDRLQMAKKLAVYIVLGDEAARANNVNRSEHIYRRGLGIPPLSWIDDDALKAGAPLDCAPLDCVLL